ncbi:MAG: AAA family ATPase [Nitrospirae bacterium]|uniref:ATP-binding protein n=1 Tax=Candidatus Magnetobacterium casense TaxID=1455061 RepID=UPI00058DBF52|nr:carbon monoxide dehydrogenase accessory protein CooC [Candidatus Magnetobacterium casensis]MBF0339200.1 AAA family ATPase [Nitrospirota bacterium]
MKIAITGKGGVGKTTLSAVLSHLYAAEGRAVIAVDADPDANLAAAFGLDKEQTKNLRPIAEMGQLIEERTGAKPGSMGGVFKLNPRVDDIPRACSIKVDGITLLVMGKSKEAASGCYCPENVFLKRLLKHLVTERDDVVIVDMEAGIEHLTRGTAEGVDAFIVVVEPGKRSIQTALVVRDMAKTLGVANVFVVAGKVRGSSDVEFIRGLLEGMNYVGSVGFSQAVVEADIKGVPPYKNAPEAVEDIKLIKNTIESAIKKTGNVQNDN